MKKTNKKGFTLVELLAVIVILAVLILLALPNVIKIMNNAKKNAFQDEAQAYLKGAQTKYIESQTTGTAATQFSNKITGAEKVDVDDKTGYEYCIVVADDGDGSLTYNYIITNGTYSAKGTGDKISDVSASKTAETIAETTTWENCKAS